MLYACVQDFIHDTCAPKHTNHAKLTAHQNYYCWWTAWWMRSYFLSPIINELPEENKLLIILQESVSFARDDVSCSRFGIGLPCLEAMGLVAGKKDITERPLHLRPTPGRHVPVAFIGLPVLEVLRQVTTYSLCFPPLRWTRRPMPDRRWLWSVPISQKHEARKAGPQVLADGVVSGEGWGTTCAAVSPALVLVSWAAVASRLDPARHPKRRSKPTTTTAGSKTVVLALCSRKPVSLTMALVRLSQWPWLLQPTHFLLSMTPSVKIAKGLHRQSPP